MGTWPRSRDLVQLEEQTLEVLYSLRGGEEVPAQPPHHARTCMNLVKVSTHTHTHTHMRTCMNLVKVSTHVHVHMYMNSEVLYILRGGPHA